MIIFLGLTIHQEVVISISIYENVCDQDNAIIAGDNYSCYGT
jgi:hypothetical protein